MKEHEYLGEVAIAVEDEVGGVFSDIDEPVEVLEEDIGEVHVDTSMLNQQRQPNQVVLDVLGLDDAGLVANSLLDLLDVLGRQVAFEVAITHYL